MTDTPATSSTAHAPATRKGSTAVRCTPTGRRTLTPAKLTALAYPPPSPNGPSRGEVFAAFCRATPALGVIPLRPFIELLMSRSFPQDWTGVTRPMVWVSNRWLCARLGVGEGRLKQLIGSAFERGLIAMREAGNGHRRGSREEGEGGRILWAYGFDLSPLAARCAEFRELADAFERREAVARQLRTELSSLRRDVLTLADLGSATMPDVTDWKDVAYRVRQVSGQGRNQQDTDVLQMLVGQLVVIRDEIRSLLAALQGFEVAESDPSGLPEELLYLNTNQDKKTELNAKANEQVQSPPGASLSAPEATNVLRNFPASPAFVLAVAPPFRDFIPNSSPTRGEIVDAAYHVRGHLGISQDAWAEACLTFGRWEAAVAVAAVAGRYAAGEVHSPGGLLRKMLELHIKGTLRLDRTLRGLLARLANPATSASSACGPTKPSASLIARPEPDKEGPAASHRPQKTWEERVRAALSKAQPTSP